jgi:transitional endoplasmic reticulum ATPase
MSTKAVSLSPSTQLAVDKLLSSEIKKGKTLDEAVKIHVAEVIRHGDQLIIPEGMAIPDVVDLLIRRLNYENETTEIVTTIDCFPFDGAAALFTVLKRKFGWVSMETVYNFFGKERPQMIEVEIDVRQTSHIPWGRLTLFKEDGYIDTTAAKKGNRWIFKAVATVRRKHEPVIKEIFAEMREEIRLNSIYRGKAVAVRFLTDDGRALPLPEASFVDVSGARKDQLIFSKEVHDSIETNLFMPIERMDDIAAAGMPVKFGVLLAGKFGVGKTLAARVAAALAVQHDITFIYCKRADEIAEAVQFAQQYEPACVFCEDIDRTLAGERTVKMDDVLNIIDGIDTKRSKLVIVLTSNDAHCINPANIRPGRIDAVIDVKPPDNFAVERLIRMYGGALVDPKADLSKAASRLAGHIPAVIEEVVKRAKRSALRRTQPGSIDILIGEEALDEAAATMRMQLDLLNPPPKDAVVTIESRLAGLVEGVVATEIEKALPKAIEKGIAEYNNN